MSIGFTDCGKTYRFESTRRLKTILATCVVPIFDIEEDFDGITRESLVFDLEVWVINIDDLRLYCDTGYNS